MTKAHNIYIHTPFCASKCNYCAFFSHACANPNWDEYHDKIIHELEYWGQKLNNPKVPTIFFGGGTPSLMPTDVFGKIISAIYKNFHVVSNAEITLESNPGTLSENKLKEFCKIGVNRLSIGVQSLDDEKLQFLGRRHSVTDALKLLENANNQNIRVSADFIYGLPQQTTQDVIKMCDEINKLGLKHCSLYELTIEKNTPFGKMNLDMPTNQTMAEMYTAIQDILNLQRYEVSNYALNGFECKHNQNVWDGGAYIGIGQGAAGRIFFNDTWYEQLGNNEKFEILTPKERAIEKVLTGLRTMRGTELTDDIRDVINMTFAKTHPNMLRFTNDNRIVATDAGILLLDDLIVKLVK